MSDELDLFDWDPSNLKGGLPVNTPLPKTLPENREERVELMLGALQNFTIKCTNCELGRKLCEERNTSFDPHVFSTMTTNRWMVVGQNPGFNECLKHEPFVGDAGKNFDNEIKKHGLKRKDFYITNMVKCHSLQNECPSREYMERCEPILRLEILVLRPKLVITLGNVAFNAFFRAEKMADHLGTIIHSDKFNVDVYPIYHPSPRNLNDEERRKIFDSNIADLCELIKACSK